jgi:hypothetical protein
VSNLELEDARHIARMTIDEVSNYLNISKRTLKRYEATGKTPKVVIECLLLLGGQLPEFSKRNDFIGWSFGSGFLYSPTGLKFTSGDVIAGRTALHEQNRLHRINVRSRRKSTVRKSAKLYRFPPRPYPQITNDLSSKEK